MAWRNRTRRNGFSLAEVRFKLGIKKKLFPVRVVEHSHKLPGEW